MNVKFIVKPEMLISLHWANRDEMRVNVELVSRVRADLNLDRFRGKFLNCNQFAKVDKSSSGGGIGSLNPSKMLDLSRL